jgi:hypothetical protein
MVKFDVTDGGCFSRSIYIHMVETSLYGYGRMYIVYVIIMVIDMVETKFLLHSKFCYRFVSEKKIGFDGK